MKYLATTSRHTTVSGTSRRRAGVILIELNHRIRSTIGRHQHLLTDTDAWRIFDAKVIVLKMAQGYYWQL